MENDILQILNQTFSFLNQDIIIIVYLCDLMKAHHRLSTNTNLHQHQSSQSSNQNYVIESDHMIRSLEMHAVFLASSSSLSNEQNNNEMI